MEKDELDKLAHSLAFDFAASVIDCNCTPMSDEALTAENIDEWWYSIENADAVSCPDIEGCASYLEARGLLERHPEHDDWVRVRDESEATS